MKKEIKELKLVKSEGITENERKAIDSLSAISYEAIKDEIIMADCEHLLGDYLSILDTLREAGFNRAGHFILILLDRTPYCDLSPVIQSLCPPEGEGIRTFVNNFMTRMLIDIMDEDEDEDEEDYFCDPEECEYFQTGDYCDDCIYFGGESQEKESVGDKDE